MDNQEVPWRYAGNTEFQIPENCIGFIYRITKIGSDEAQPWVKLGTLSTAYIGRVGYKTYIGKKLLTSNRKGKVTKKEIKETGTRKRVKRIIKDSGWKTYNSSCKPLQQEMKEHPEWFYKEILYWCWGKKQMSYLETKEQILHESLERDSYNDHVQNWWRRDLINPNK